MDDIDFEKDGKKSKMVLPPKGSDESVAKQQAEREERKADENKKGAEEYKNNPRYDTEKKLRSLQLRGGSLGGGMKPGQSPSLDNPIKMAKGGMTASKRADGCCVKGKTKGRMV